MKLTGENRAIVALGLRDLPSTKNFGLKALMEVADCTSEMTSMHIGFRIAPRINAAGRMDAAKQIVELFETESFDEARILAQMLDSRNKERQKVQQEITEKALLATENLADAKFIVVSGEGWHRGVIGLAASRIAERLHRPTIVLSSENGTAHGSARSVGNFHLLNALEHCGDLMDQFGGHAAAAGMKIPTDRIDDLMKALDAYAADVLSEDDLLPTLKIDARLSDETLGLNILQEIDRFEPFGAGNPKPVFVTRGLKVKGELRVMKEKHLKIYLESDAGKRFEAVWWDGVDRSKGQTLDSGSRIEVAYTTELNVWQGTQRLQLVVQDIRADNQH
jgi:single-stranded-DNA-specific exonuclease